MPEPRQIQATIMFADICRSTYLFSELGDEQAAKLVSDALRIAATLVQKRDGVVLRTKGDDILCIFKEPLNAFEASMAIHHRFSDSADDELSMRVGINSGSALLADGDLLGDSVNTAARLANFAKAGQTIVSAQTIELLGNLPYGMIRPLGDISLKGKSTPVTVFELLDSSRQGDITQMGSLSAHFPRSNLLSIRYQSFQNRLDYRLQRFLLGRHLDCDLVIEHPLVSRHHAEIRYQNNEFVLIDFSTNGTKLITSGQPRSIHHAQAALRGSGSIFLGRTVYNRSMEISFQASGGSRPFSQMNN